MKEYYYNERYQNRPDWGGTPDSSSGGSGGSIGGSGGTWGGGETEKIPDPEYVDPEIISRLTPEGDESGLRVSAHGLLLADADGFLLSCNQRCKQVPSILVTIDTETDQGHHARCIQLNLIYSNLNPLVLDPEKTLCYDLWPVDRNMPRELLPENAQKIHYAGSFPLPEPGEVLTIKAAWQRGHYNINEVSLMNFWIFNVNCGTKSIGTGNWRNIARITVDELYRITVNGLRGELPGGKRN